VESLDVLVSAALCLYETVRQRGCESVPDKVTVSH